jgi:acetoacetyl-CoA synthetase
VAEWFYDCGFPTGVHLLSTCGGTDLACSLISGVPTQPLYAGEIQGPSLGMAVDVFAMDEGTPTRSIRAAGSAGELVCTQPFPSQPLYFWGDPTGQRYRSSYFSKYGSATWAQGDFISMNPATGGFLMHGRSDGVLNPAGVRFGSAEIYNVLAREEEVVDSLCVGQRRAQDSDETVVLFVQLARGSGLTSSLAARLRERIINQLTPRHAPRYIFAAPEVPYTVNGKKVEIIVKKIISGQEVSISATIANPHCLGFYEQFVKIEEVHTRQLRAWKESKL